MAQSSRARSLVPRSRRKIEGTVSTRRGQLHDFLSYHSTSSFRAAGPCLPGAATQANVCDVVPMARVDNGRFYHRTTGVTHEK